MTVMVAATVVVVVVAATVPICRRPCTGGVDIKLFNFYDNYDNSHPKLHKRIQLPL